MKKYVLFIVFSIICVASGCASAHEVDETEAKVICGNARIDEYIGFLQGRRVGLVVNQSSVVDGVHLCDTLMSLGVDVRKIFSPEHGFRGDADAGEHVKGGRDAKTGLEIVSLYGKNKKPNKEQLADIDVVVYDLQDVGVRFYTYISTLHYVMEACAESELPFVVLDRPNPNGDYIDGPVLESDCKSFIGIHLIPIVYGMTCGELAYMINGEGWLSGGLRCNLKVIAMTNYDRNGRHELTVAPSPNLRDYKAIRLYPSLCFFEGSNVSVGRGTQKPFMIYGSPKIKSGTYAFMPQSVAGSKSPIFKDVKCVGFDLTESIDEARIDLSYLLGAYREIGDSAFWFNARHFDLLAGTKSLRQQLKKGFSEAQIRATWETKLQDFKAKRAKYLIYNERKPLQVEPICWQDAVKSQWVDSVLGRLTLDEKIAQLVWVTICGTANEREVSNAVENVERYGVGGVLILQGTPKGALEIVNMLRSKTRVPLLFSADAENGMSMKFKEVVDFPKNITLGAISDLSLIEKLGHEIGEQISECGIQVNFAPVVDVNTNPLNPIIGMRSFGENPRRVAEVAKAHIKGLQAEGCVGVVKHFPGHGETSQDSHSTLPLVGATRERLDSVELYPFVECIKAGVMGVMSAHLNVPTIDNEVKSMSMSSKALSGLLREQIGFEGLIVTDAVNMAGLKIAADGANVESLCLKGGNDVVEFSLDVKGAVESTKALIRKGELTEADIDARVRRVLAIKEWCAKYGRDVQSVEGKVNDIEKENLSDLLFKESVTILQNNNIELSNRSFTTFGTWPDVKLDNTDNGTEQVHWLFVDDKSIAAYNQYVAALPRPMKVVVVYTGNPYRINRLQLRDTDGLVVLYESTSRAKRIAMLYAKQRFEARGVMPVSVGKFREGTTFGQAGK